MEADNRIFSFQSISKVCNDIIVNNPFREIDDIITGCKILAIIFVLVNIYVQYIKGIQDKEEGKNKPITFSYIIKQFLFLALIFYFPDISSAIDNLLSAFCTSIENTVNDMNGSLYDAVNTAVMSGLNADQLEYLETMESQGDVTLTIRTFTSTISNLLNPIYWITTLLQWIGWLMNIFIVAFMLLERGALLIVLNLLSPFILALSVLEKFRDLFYKWIKLYIVIFLISPTLLVMSVIASLFYTGLSGIGYNIFGLTDTNMLYVVILVVFVKARLIRAGVTHLYKLFSV